MWVPELFRVTDEAVIQRLIDRVALATLVTSSPEGCEICHVPMRAVQTNPWVLVGHVARENPQGARVLSGAQATAVFRGPHGYISPLWYHEKPSVPTWDYATVHVSGKLVPRQTDDEVLDDLDAMARHYEGPSGWDLHSLPAAYRDALIRGIVGFELRGDHVEAQFKLSQNHREDVETIIDRLLDSERLGDQELGELLRSHYSVGHEDAPADERPR